MQSGHLIAFPDQKDLCLLELKDVSCGCANKCSLILGELVILRILE